MRNDFCSGYLIHHGIQGQKWGVRNGPPYPLDSKARSSAEKNSEKPKGLTKKQKTYIAIGATAAVTALAIYGTYKLGGPKEIAKSARRLELMIKSGKKASKPHMKMNLQYFAVKGKRTKKPNLSPSQFKKSKKLRLSASAYDTIVMSFKRDHKDRLSKEGIFSYGFRDYTYFIRSDGNGHVEILTRQPIKDAITDLKERIPYVPDIKK